ncbi:hypothetical protein [Thalassotalea aquiviva]|uniref:hypothetical protein n=1 Tax=Thalassotalea aquiviva TaxID=3242415 RepID=UPI00352A3DB2
MNIIRNVMAIIVGIIVGGFVNISIVSFGPSMIPAPAGVDVTNMKSIAQSIHLFEPKHFLFPFIGHAVGTFVGALCAFLIAASYPVYMAIVVGCVFLAGGITSAFMIPAPLWFVIVDIVFAYLPMALVAALLIKKIITNRY